MTVSDNSFISNGVKGNGDPDVIPVTSSIWGHRAQILDLDLYLDSLDLDIDSFDITT